LTRLYFNTTPDVRVPAYVLVPTKSRRPLPGLVALHDHGGFYLWGKEKLVETDDEPPALTDFKKRYYAGASIATALARQGYVVVVIDMFYWGERRMLLDGDPDDWRRRSSESEQLVGRTAACPAGTGAEPGKAPRAWLFTPGTGTCRRPRWCAGRPGPGASPHSGR
jgi:dienelactone hydrolase